MKKIQFSNHIFEKQIINFDNNLAIIIGESGSGKTEILNTLEQGLKGKLHEFYVDEQQVDHDGYQIVYLKEYFNIKESLKLGKTSPLRNSLVQNINKNIINASDDKYQNIIKKLEEVHENFNSLLNTTTFEKLNKSQINNSLTLKANLESFSINNIIDKLLKLQIVNNDTNNIIDEDNYSHFMLRILLFNILKNTLDFNDKLRPTIILFDLPELYGTPKILHQLNVWLNKLLNDSITIIIVSNSPEYLVSLNPSLTSINLIKNNNINSITNFTKIIKDAIILFSFYESKHKDLILYKSNLMPLLEDKDIEKEKMYINNQIYEIIIKSLFFEKIILTTKEKKEIKNEKFNLKYVSNIRNLIFIYIILLNGFNTTTTWDYENIDNFNKLKEYFIEVNN